MSLEIISLLIFGATAALVWVIGAWLWLSSRSRTDQRLDQLAERRNRLAVTSGAIWREPFGQKPSDSAGLLRRCPSLRRLFEQAGVSITPRKLAAVSVALFLGGGAVGWFATGSPLVTLSLALSLAPIPVAWLAYKRSVRLRKFAAQLPDALELVARALRAGHSLAAGLQVVAQEMPAPIAQEFGRVYEEQNLGVTIQDALVNMTDRVPDLDLKFFATAVVIQRTSGGDLAEILDKIGYVVRERFKIHGQVRALTAEGRLSGIVLMMLPPFLFMVVYRLNPAYVQLLFAERMGVTMLGIAAALQVVGAVVIKKIVTIKV
jgi:tight adherence protein B